MHSHAAPARPYAVAPPARLSPSLVVALLVLLVLLVVARGLAHAELELVLLGRV